MAGKSGPDIIENGLLLYYDVANKKSYPGSGTSWYDLSGNENTITLTNGPTYNAANLGSILFDGTNDYVESSNFSGAGNTYFTLNIWFYKPSSWANAYRKLAIISLSVK
mgnify:CR=1 FL=1